MPEFTKAQEIAAGYRNKITYAMTILGHILEKDKKPSEKEIKLALDGLREASEFVSQMSRL